MEYVEPPQCTPPIRCPCGYWSDKDEGLCSECFNKMIHKRKLFDWKQREQDRLRKEHSFPKSGKIVFQEPETIVREMEIVLVPPPDKNGKVNFMKSKKHFIEVRTNLSLPESSLNSLQRETTLFSPRNAANAWAFEKNFR